MAKYIVKIIIFGAKILGRALVKTLIEEVAARKAAGTSRVGQQRVDSGASKTRSGISIEEALKILNCDTLDPEKVQKNYEHLFKANEKHQGGSFYIQSKIVRAKERIDEELRVNKKMTSQKEETDI